MPLSIYIFRCPDCLEEEPYTSKEVPWGDPDAAVKYCDHCNGKLVYVRRVKCGRSYERKEDK